MLLSDLKLNKFLVNALDDMGYVYATPIQVEAMPVISSGKDVVGIAQTGTGKTLAYLLPILKQLTFSEQKNPRVLIVVPTRELVMQVVGEIEKLTTYMNIRTIGVYGGANINTQRQEVFKGLDILVATPGRLLDLVLDGSIRLKSLQKFILDEVDEMLNLGFRTQLNNLLDILPEKRQNLMFSATLDSEVDDLIQVFFNSPVKVEIAPTGTPLEKIEQRVYHVPNFNTKVNLLVELLKQDSDMQKVLVFVESKRVVDRLFDLMNNHFVDRLGVIHSNKSQNQRFRSIEDFEKNKISILIATDIIARGLDIQHVTHVVSFDTPKIATNYIHRIGRTGRAENSGVAITFVNEVEYTYQQEIESFMGQEIPLWEIPEEVKISDIFLDEEKPSFTQKQYVKPPKISKSQGNVHEKKEKNKKVNLGGSYRRKIKAKYKKPKTRGSKK